MSVDLDTLLLQRFLDAEREFRAAAKWLRSSGDVDAQTAFRLAALNLALARQEYLDSRINPVPDAIRRSGVFESDR